MNYKILKNSAIDKADWDAQIDHCFNAKVFAKSWFLDIVAPNWKACIVEDNQALIPITVSLKFGIIPVWYQPLLCQQLGVFAQSAEKDYLEVLNKIKSTYFLTNIHLNDGFLYPSGIEKRVNYILDLSKGYETLRAGYNKDARKNLRKPLSISIIEEPIDAPQMDELIEVYKNQYGDKQTVSKKLAQTIKNLMLTASKHQAAEAYKIMDDQGNLLFKGVILKDAKRLYYSFAAPTDMGRKANITHHFIDHLIQKYAGSNLLLDFEGSSIPSVAQFYAKWGSEIKVFGVLK